MEQTGLKQGNASSQTIQKKVKTPYIRVLKEDVNCLILVNSPELQ